MRGEWMRATWYYAYEQWLAESPEYAVDWERLPFEQYLGPDCLIYIPVKPKTSINPEEEAARRAASEHPPVLLLGKRGRWDRWDEEHGK